MGNFMLNALLVVLCVSLLLFHPLLALIYAVLFLAANQR